jgi:hypothetical protein
MTRLVSAVARPVRALDRAAGRRSGCRSVLVEARTPMNLVILAPVYRALARDRRIRLFFTFADGGPAFPPLPQDAGLGPTLPREVAAWMRFDLYMNADPWGAVELHRCARRLNLFHGVAGKYDLDSPAGLPLGFRNYDRVAFVNRDRMDRYLAAAIVTPGQAALIGFPKIDGLARGEYNARAVRSALGLDPGCPTVVYGPTFSRASSLHLAGLRIVGVLLDAGFNVVVKLHDRSFDTGTGYTAGIDWRARMGVFAGDPHFAMAEGPDSSPLLAAADLVVTDHSSIGFEFLVIDRPLIVYDAPALQTTARINPEKVQLLRGAATVVDSPIQLANAARAALAAPERLSGERRRVARQMFHDPGGATDRAVAVAYELMEMSAETVGPFVATRPQDMAAVAGVSR